MKINRIITILMSVALTLAFTTPAEAQLGNIINKAKRVGKEKVENKVKKAANKEKEKEIENIQEKATEKTPEKATEKVTEKSEVSVISNGNSSDNKGVTELQTLYKKDFKPSKEAIAAFPDAARTDQWERSSRPFNLVYGAYEHLDPKYFPLQPYYKYPVMYGLGMKAIVGMNVLDDMIRTRLANGFGSTTKFLPFIYDENENTELLTPVGEKMGVYRDDIFRYAYAAAFFADPNSDIAIYRLAELLAYLSPTISSGVETEADDDANGILDAKKGLVLPASNYKSLRGKREIMMMNMATEVVDMDLIADRVIKCLEKVEENDAFCQKDPSLRAKYLLMGTQLYERILTNHKGWRSKKGSDPKARRATMLYTLYNQTPEALAILRNVRAGNVPAVSMPKGVSVSADIKAKGDAAGKVLAGHRGDEFVKVVYLENQWSTFKQPTWPYKVMHYSIKADLITKAGGKTVLTHCELHKSVDGSNYVMVVGKDSEKHPIK